MPGFAGDEVELELVSLGPGGLPIREAADPDAHPGLPRAALDEDDRLVLRRMAENPWEDGYQLYLSEEVAAIADLRAGRDYVRSTEEEKDEECTRCDGEELGLDPDGRDLLSGHSIAVRVPEALRQQLAEIYGEDRLDQLEIAVESVPWDVSPAVRQEPTQNPATGTGDVVPGTLLHSGEMTLAGSDLYVRGRGMDVAFQRTYRSQTVGAGPLGPGWDHVYRQRLRALPDGSVEYYDGRGRRELFEKKEGEEGFEAPPGRYVDLSTLERNAAGWTLLTAQRHALRFDRFGRLTSIVDAVKDAPDTGNEITFQYDLASNLTRIEDALDRAYTFEYDDEGRITKLKDFSGREVTYVYDQHGRLESVTSPKVTVGESAFPSGLVTRYEYETPAGDLAGKLNTRDNVKSVRNPRGEEWLRLTYDDEDGDDRNDEVVSQQWGTGSVSLSYGFGARVTNVTDRRGSPIEYRFNEAGQALSVKDPLGSITSFEYDDEGNLTRQVAPLGTVTEMSYDSGGGERSRGNMTEAKVSPGTGGANGSSSSIRTPFEYDGRTNLPTRVTDAGGTVTQVTRNRGGLPTQIRQGVGTPNAAQTTVEYNAYGQPVRTVNANGHETRLEYHESGASKGYLARTIVDPDGLALTSSYEYDERSNVTAVTDPRGVRSEFVYNELDWLVEQRLATSPAADGAPALSYVARTLYDENGNVVEERLPFDDGATSTRVRASYGTLDEVLSIQREHAPNQFVSETYNYDPNLNLLVTTRPNGQVAQFTYDERNLVTQVAGGLPGINPPVAITYSYDEEGRLKLHTDARGKVWTFSYDGYQRPFETTDPLGQRTRTLYDDRGNPVEVARFDAGGCLVGLNRTFYDDQGRPFRIADNLWETRPAGEPCNGLPSGAREVSLVLEYDRFGNVTKTVDPLGHASLAFYDAAERLRETHDAAGNVAKYSLDPAGNVRRKEALEEGAGRLDHDGYGRAHLRRAGPDDDPPRRARQHPPGSVGRARQPAPVDRSGRLPHRERLRWPQSADEDHASGRAHGRLWLRRELAPDDLPRCARQRHGLGL